MQDKQADEQPERLDGSIHDNDRQGPEGVDEANAQQLDDIKVEIDDSKNRSSDMPMGTNADPAIAPGARLEFQGELSGQGFEKTFYLQPVCFSLRRAINYLGALLATLMAPLDILYLLKANFGNSTIFLTLLLFWVFRIIITAAVAFRYLYSNYIHYEAGTEEKVEDESYNSNAREPSTEASNDSNDDFDKNGRYLYYSYFPLIYCGFFRLMPSESFRRELFGGYMMQLFLGILPTLFCQIWTNTEHNREMKPIMSAAIVVKILLLLLSMFEIPLMLIEMRMVRRMQEDKVHGYKPVPEAQKRAGFYRRGFCLAVFSSVLVVLILIIGAAAAPGRNCANSQTLSMGVCYSCEDKNCDSCSGNSYQCDACKVGFTQFGGKCYSCNVDETNPSCKECDTTDGSATICKTCHIGHRLAGGKCFSCEKTADNCEQCSASECKKCDNSFWLNADKKSNAREACEDCSREQNPHCGTCESSQKCLACNENIARLNTQTGKCTECRTDLGWKQDKIKKCVGYDNNQKVCFKEEEVPGTRCTCDGFVDTNDGNKCKKCSDLIPGCTQCEQVDKVEGEESFYNTGFHRFDSGIAGLNRPYIICRKGDNSLVQVSDAQGKPALKKCDQIVTGCFNCNNDGQTCIDCHYRFYKTPDNKCRSCDDTRIFGNCVHCDRRGGCTECKGGNFKFGYKCFTKFW